jgi:hypothetical protein
MPQRTISNILKNWFSKTFFFMLHRTKNRIWQKQKQVSSIYYLTISILILRLYFVRNIKEQIFRRRSDAIDLNSFFQIFMLYNNVLLDRRQYKTAKKITDSARFDEWYRNCAQYTNNAENYAQVTDIRPKKKLTQNYHNQCPEHSTVILVKDSFLNALFSFLILSVYTSPPML